MAARADTRRWVVPFLLFAALLAVARLHTYSEPPERDITTYAVIGHEMLGGRSLYTDLWDHKPPAVHVTFALAESIVGYGPAAIYSLVVVAAVLALLAVMMAAAAMGLRAALWAGAFWVVVSGDLMLQANQPNTEVFINAALALAFALLVRPAAEERRTWVWLCVGGLLALACLYKPIAIVTAGLFLATSGAVSWSTQRRAALRGPLLASAVLAAVGLSLLAYFAAVDSLAAFWDGVVVYNRDYQMRGWQEEHSLAARLLPSSTWFLLPLILLMLAGVGLGQRGRDARLWLWLSAYLLGSAISILLPGQLHAHYFQLWLPPFCIGAAWGLDEYAQRQPRVARIAGLAALAACLAYEIPSFALSADQWSEKKYGAYSRYGAVFVTARDLAAKIDAILLPGETFFEFGDETGLYFHSNRRPPSGVLYVYPLLKGPLTDDLSSRLVADLKRERPELVVVNGTYARGVGDGEITFADQAALGEILPAYRLRWIVRGMPTFFLFSRAGGELETRLASSPRPRAFALLEESATADSAPVPPPS